MWDVTPQHQVIENGHMAEQFDILKRARDAETGDGRGAPCRQRCAPRSESPRVAGGYNPLIQLSRLVLPAPFGPMMA
jgi:hypothetical protein